MNQLKLIFSKIIVGSKLFKKTIYLKLNKKNKKVINLLWDEGFIYGYYIKQKVYKIFLKFCKKNISLLNNLRFLHMFVNYKYLKKFVLFEKQSYIFIFNNNNCYFFSSFIKKRIGGIIFIKE